MTLIHEVRLSEYMRVKMIAKTQNPDHTRAVLDDFEYLILCFNGVLLRHSEKPIMSSPQDIVIKMVGIELWVTTYAPVPKKFWLILYEATNTLFYSHVGD